MNCNFSSPKNIPFYLLTIVLLYFVLWKAVGIQSEDVRNLFAGVGSITTALIAVMGFTIAYKKFVLDESVVGNSSEANEWTGNKKGASVESLKLKIQQLHKQNNQEELMQLATEHLYERVRLSPEELQELFRRAFKQAEYELRGSKDPRDSKLAIAKADKLISDTKEQWRKKQQ